MYLYFGPGGLNIWTAVMVTITFSFIWLTMRGGIFLRAFVLVLAATASGVYWAARPYLITFLLAAIFVWILEEYRWRSNQAYEKKIWLLPLMMILWVNSHGGYIVGFLIWGVYLSSELISKAWSTWVMHKIKFTPRNFATPLAWVGIIMLLAVMINPYGPKMLLYPFKTINIGVLRDFIQEWQSPQFHEIAVQPFVWMLLLTFGAVGISRKRLAFIDFSLVALFAYMGLLAGRNIALFSLVAPMVLTRHAAPTLEALTKMTGLQVISTSRPKKPLRVLNYGIFVALVIAVLLKVSLIYPVSANESAFRLYLPVDAVAYIREEKPDGYLFNSYNWGGYLLWSLPEYQVFVDGRTDLYNDEIIGEWLKVVQVQNDWEDILSEYKVRMILIENDSSLDKALREQIGWVAIYRDKLAVIFEKE